jgi:hypothetical protein
MRVMELYATMEDAAEANIPAMVQFCPKVTQNGSKAKEVEGSEKVKFHFSLSFNFERVLGFLPRI